MIAEAGTKRRRQAASAGRWCGAALWLAALSGAADDGVTVWVEPANTTRGEPVVLRLEADRALPLAWPPDAVVVAALANEHKVIPLPAWEFDGGSDGPRVRRYRLYPVRAGLLEVPPLVLPATDGTRTWTTPAIPLRVRDGAGAAAGAGPRRGRGLAAPAFGFAVAVAAAWWMVAVARALTRRPWVVARRRQAAALRAWRRAGGTATAAALRSYFAALLEREPASLTPADVPPAGLGPANDVLRGQFRALDGARFQRAGAAADRDTADAGDTVQRAMRRAWRCWWRGLLPVLCLLAGADPAAGRPLERVRATIETAATNVVLNGTFEVVATVHSGNWDLEPEMRWFCGGPDAEPAFTTVWIRELAPRYEERNGLPRVARRFRWRLRAKLAGFMAFEPRVMVTGAGERGAIAVRPEGVMMMVQPLGAEHGPRTAVGRFDVVFHLRPAEPGPGDVAQVVCVVRGDGYLPDDAWSGITAAPGFRLYAPQSRAVAGGREYVQPVVNVSGESRRLPAPIFQYADPEAGSLRTVTAPARTLP